MDLLSRFLAPLFVILPKLLGLRLLKESTMETLNTHDELARRAESGDAASRALLAQFGQNVAAIMGADGAYPPPPANPAGSPGTPASLGSSVPFALAGPASEAKSTPAAEPKKRGRPAKAKPEAASPPDGDGQESGPGHLRNGILH